MPGPRTTSPNPWPAPNCCICCGSGSTGKTMMLSEQSAGREMTADARDGFDIETVNSVSMEDKADILLVDDRRDKCLAMETVLADLGQNVVTVHSGKEALRQLLERDFAVILLDVNMPGLDGFETACLIRQRKNSEHTPI